MKIPHQIAAITARQVYQLGYFFILTDFTACTHLWRSISGQQQNLTAMKIKILTFQQLYLNKKNKILSISSVLDVQ